MKKKRYDGTLTDIGPYDGGVYLYRPDLGYNLSMAEVLTDFLDMPIIIEERDLKTKKKITFTANKRYDSLHRTKKEEE